jgi:hypothetical protein
MTPATCHAERPVKARGLCSSCYGRWYYTQGPPPPPLPPRCRHYYVKARPEIPPDAVRRVLATPPTACPKCGSAALRGDGHAFACFICGATWWVDSSGGYATHAPRRAGESE